MKIYYDSLKIQQLIEDFSNVTKLPINFLDYSSNLIATATHEYSFCKAIQQSYDGIDKCACCDNELIAKCIRTLQPQKHVCHAGLTDIVVPIIKNDVFLGVMLFGRIRNTDDFDAIYEKISWTGYNYNFLKEEFYMLVKYNDKQIDSLINIAATIVSHAVTSNLFNNQYDDLTEKISDYITDNLDKKLSVSLLCKHFAISKNILYEHFHSAFKCTVSEFITKKRLEKIKLLIMNTDISLNEIAISCGIFDYNYFFSFFKKHEGMTPSEFRNEYSLKNKEFFTL